MSTIEKARLFGTDGIRGEPGEFPLDQATVVAIGRAIGEILAGEILVGRDPRESGPGLLAHVRAGVHQSGQGRVRDLGILPTPAVALLTQRSGAAGGVMISASHNPFKDNGIKVFGPSGEKLDDAGEARIEERVAGILAMNVGDRVLTSAHDSDTAPPNPARALWTYLGLLLEGFPTGPWLSGLRIVIDCAHGATSRVAPILFRSLGAAVTTLSASPDGRNINDGCGAVYPEALVEWMRSHRADLGVAYDGDGDRSMFVSETGRLIDGDGVLLVMARALSGNGHPKPRSVVGTSMTNVALEQMLGREGIRLERVDVGDRYVFRKMRDDAIPLGGEPSGHIIFPDHRLSGDGLLTTLKLCEVLRSRQKSLEELTRDWVPAPQLLRNLPVARKVPLDELPRVSSKISEINELLTNRGRIVVRYSGTEPLLRIMIESDSAETNQALAEELAQVVASTIR
jgi:phosphoglucosamine mutase